MEIIFIYVDSVHLLKGEQSWVFLLWDNDTDKNLKARAQV